MAQQAISDAPATLHDALAGMRVQQIKGPLGAVRLTVRAIGEAEGFVFCRHRSNQPFALSLDEWRDLPLAENTSYDI